MSPHFDNAEPDKLHSPRNAAIFLEKIKQEVDCIVPANVRTFNDPDIPESSLECDTLSMSELGSRSLKSSKIEIDAATDGEEAALRDFASLLDSAMQGLMPIPELILRFENSCRNISESIRFGSRHHWVAEDKMINHKAQLLLDEAATWLLLWFLYGKETEELLDEYNMSPTTSHLEMCSFVANDHTAQLCLRIVHWLESLASKALDLESKVRGSHVGIYLPNSGIWYHTQRFLKRDMSSKTAFNTIHHLDFDAPTREHADQLPDDKKQDESLLEDVWTLLKAGRLEEACDICRSAGQPWRAASLCPFGGLNLSPSMDALVKNGTDRILQAVELESGIGYQWRLWKWASYCASEKIAEQNGGKYETAVFAFQCSNLKHLLSVCADWESACWAIAKCWLDVQIDLELLHFQPNGGDKINSFLNDAHGDPEPAIWSSHPNKIDNWPLQVLNQQPRNLSALLQKLHSCELVNEAVMRACKEKQRQVEMDLMMGDIPHLLDMIWSWIAPSDDEDNFRPHGDPQLIRFGTHLVLVIRHLLDEESRDAFKEKLLNVGDCIVQMYSMFLFSKQHEELVGIYASHLAAHRCVDLYVHMMELRINSSLSVKYKLFLSAVEYLPFSWQDNSKASFEVIIERVLSRSREVQLQVSDESQSVIELHHSRSIQKAMVVQWLCFLPPSTIVNANEVTAKLLLLALLHSNILFREFSLASLWRIPSLPVGAHTLLSFLAEPLKKLPEIPDALKDSVSANMEEFQDWNEFYACDATYRKWIKACIENAEVPSQDISEEEKQQCIEAAKETLHLSLSLLSRKENSWLSTEHRPVSIHPLFLELQAVTMLCMPSGECMHPDPTVCSTLMSALYSSVDEEVVSERQLAVNVGISSKDKNCIEIVIRCLAKENDGLRQPLVEDGGLLATVLASGIKGELVHFHSGVTMEIFTLNTWYSSGDGYFYDTATYIVHGLCRRCCIPELILRYMQVSISLLQSGYHAEKHEQFIELIACPRTGYTHLFSQQQLQDFLLLEREYVITKLGLNESHS